MRQRGSLALRQFDAGLFGRKEAARKPTSSRRTSSRPRPCPHARVPRFTLRLGVGHPRWASLIGRRPRGRP